MKCGICQQPLDTLKAICSCQKDPYAGYVLAERYKLLGRIAKGGMGIVYRAIRLEDDTLCAIKISRWSEALQQLRQYEPQEAREEEEARLQREFKLLEKASSQTPHIVQVFDEMRDDQRTGLYYPMEFLEGQPLSAHPHWNQAMDKKDVVELILQMSEGISIAHGLGVVHRDLNPDNVFIVKQGDQEQFVKLIDFGIARDLYARREIYRTGHDMAFGHLHYMAPEQVGYSPKTGTYERETAAKLDTRADIYTIGAIMFHMLTGYPPFEDDTLEGLAVRDWEEPTNVKRAKEEGLLPSGLRDIITSCLEADPNNRPPDIFVLRDMLQTYHERPTNAAPPPPPGARKDKGFLDSQDLLQATSDSSGLWSAFDEEVQPGQPNALDQFSQDFNNIFEDDIAEIEIEEAPSPSAISVPSLTPIRRAPADILAALENAPAFLDEDDEDGMFFEEDAMYQSSDSLEMAAPSILELPNDTTTNKPANGAHHPIEAMIADTIQSQGLPTPPKTTSSPPLLLWAILGLLFLGALAGVAAFFFG